MGIGMEQGEYFEHCGDESRDAGDKGQGGGEEILLGHEQKCGDGNHGNEDWDFQCLS